MSTPQNLLPYCSDYKLRNKARKLVVFVVIVIKCTSTSTNLLSSKYRKTKIHFNIDLTNHGSKFRELINILCKFVLLRSQEYETNFNHFKISLLRYFNSKN